MTKGTKDLHRQTTDLLKKIEQNNVTPDDIDGISEVLRFHERRYYIDNDPLISYSEYDRLYKQLATLGSNTCLHLVRFATATRD